MKYSKFIAMIGALVLAGSASLAAPAPQRSTASASQNGSIAYRATPNNRAQAGRKKHGVHKLMGTVGSITNSKLVLIHIYMNTEKNIYFRVTPQTKRQGHITYGTHVIVYYRVNPHGNRIATRVKQQPSHG